MKDRIVTQLPIALRRRLDPTKKYLVAVSGGADSLALADGMLQSGLTFAVCHVEHGIRGEASLADAAFVERFCRERSIPFFRKPPVNCATGRFFNAPKKKRLILF